MNTELKRGDLVLARCRDLECGKRTVDAETWPEPWSGTIRLTNVHYMACPRCLSPLEWERAPVTPGFQPEAGKPFQLEDLTPVRDRLIVAPLAVSSRSKGGIHLVETGHQRERPQHGIVLATGAGVWNPAKTARVPVEAAVGDCVFYGKYSGQAFDIGDREVLNMSEAEVFSILRQGAFVLVEHENPKLNHLAGDFCDLCATPEELAAKARLEQERAALVERPGGAIPFISGMSPAAGAGPAEPDESAARNAIEAERERMRQLREGSFSLKVD